MTAHLVADPGATGAAVFPARPEWLTLSAALADEVPVIADREDLLVSIAPGAGGGAPACFDPARAVIEIDGTHLGVDPATVDPANLADRARYATAWGLLTHECGHAKHTAWDAPEGTPPAVIAAAMLLEEPRMEAAQIRRRPDDRHWLRASATNLILADTDATDPARAPKMTTADAAHTAALVLARVDGGILTATETAPVATVVESILGADMLAELRALWREALRTADDDAEAMIGLGRRWCKVIGTDPDSPTPPDPASSSAPDPSGGSPVPSPLTEAIGKALANVARAVADEPPPEDPAVVAAAAKAAEDAAREDAEDAARTVFSSEHYTGTGRTAIAGTRKPTAKERTAARVLARALSTAGVRDRVAVKSTSLVPPGRLRMRGALAADAQRAAGAMPTAEPFTRTTRRTVPTPPLRLGIACDVSGSMGRLRRPVASTAWILANAARHATVPVDTATVIFGRYVRPITRPGTVPDVVTEFEADDDYENITTATAALDGALGLSQPGAARLLVIVSDGHLVHTYQRHEGQKLINRLRANGCAVLWLTNNPGDTPLDGVTVHQLTNPTATAQAIGRAATAALRAAR
ncbi:von Willebrand factor A [Kibdelosporangium sp. 4NS15]|uniref:von Willebrand factor A n=1 Tax=Kibdelosporangium persicum TaxID=2698649 RepID=A0ABX2F445_9PSEU|nr:VWA domain-containing protein [Kibdelosporangium persicum]NRN65746.1 von Willebrand factor A [Kibdelosporangium persicum]